MVGLYSIVNFTVGHSPAGGMGSWILFRFACVSVCKFLCVFRCLNRCPFSESLDAPIVWFPGRPWCTRTGPEPTWTRGHEAGACTLGTTGRPASTGTTGAREGPKAPRSPISPRPPRRNCLRETRLSSCGQRSSEPPYDVHL